MIQATPPLGDLLRSWLGALHIAAFRAHFRPILQPLRNLPFGIGGWIRDRIESILDEAESFASSWGQTALWPLHDFLQRSRLFYMFWTDGAVRAADSGLHAVWRIRFIYVPAAVGQARAEAQQYTAAVEHLVYLVRDQLLGYTQGLVGQARAEAQQYTAAVEHLVYLVRDQFLGYTQGLVGQARAEAQQYTAAVEHLVYLVRDQLLGVVRDTRAELIDLVGRGRGELADLIAFGLRQERDMARGEVELEAQERERRVQQAEARLTALRKEIMALSCIEQCDTLGKLGQELSGIDVLGLFRFVGALERDQLRAGRIIAGEVTEAASPVISSVQNLLRSL